MSALEDFEHRARRFQDRLTALECALNAVLAGQGRLVRELLTGVLAGGHVLLEGLPGLGKTQLAKALAHGLDLPLSRIQCTPDLMPGDITGSELLMQEDGRQQLVFRPGPLFAPLVLVDEINRATPRSQAALLEAMQEGQVTQGGINHPLPRPFWVLATQNPIELEGTYPLPEAQLDRFLFKLRVDYPAPEALLELVALSLDGEPAAGLAPLVERGELPDLLARPREVVIATPVRQGAVDLLLALQPDRPQGHPLVRRQVRYGPSPRGLQSLLRAARVTALADGRGHLALADLQSVALPALRHRLLLTLESELEGVAVDDLLGSVLEDWHQKWRTPSIR